MPRNVFDGASSPTVVREGLFEILGKIDRALAAGRAIPIEELRADIQALTTR